MKLRVVDGPTAVAATAADELAGFVDGIAEPLLALPTGNTAVPLYDELARRKTDGGLDLSAAHGFNLDELLLPPEHPDTFRAFMERHAWNRTGLDQTRFDIPDPSADPETECRRYDRAISSAGRLDVAILGVGTDGHVAYNLPGAAIERTHVVVLPARFSRRLDPPSTHRPLRAITMGLGPLRHARKILLMATGASKAESIRRLAAGSSDIDWPCTLLLGHPDFEVVVDRAAASSPR